MKNNTVILSLDDYNDLREYREHHENEYEKTINSYRTTIDKIKQDMADGYEYVLKSEYIGYG